MSGELEDALRALFKLIEEGDLVRNIDNDNDTMKFLAQGARITVALKKAYDVLEKAKAEGGR